MCEILLVVWLCSSLGKVLREKGRKPLVFQILLGISWFVGEVGGAIIGGIFLAISGGGGGDGFDFTIYIFALIGAACAAGFWFAVAYAMPPVEQPWSAAGAGVGGKVGPTIGPPPGFDPPADPNNPYSPPRSDA